MVKTCDKFNSKELLYKIEKEDVNKVIIPFGSFESHGNHLPLGTDTFISRELSKGILEKIDDAILLPSIPFGTSIHYNKFPMSVTLRYETLIMMTEDILRSVINYGFQNIVIINGHDGNIPGLEIACRKIKDEYIDVNILYIPGWWFYTSEKLKNIFDSQNGRGHGGEAETSLGMYLNLEGVDSSRFTVENNKHLNNINQYRIDFISDILDRSMEGSTGESKNASVEKGEKIYNSFISYVVNLINYLDEIDWDIKN